MIMGMGHVEFRAWGLGREQQSPSKTFESPEPKHTSPLQEQLGLVGNGSI